MKKTGFTPLKFFKNFNGVKQNNQKIRTGFTLIELLIVIAIIGLLATIVMVSLNSARMKAKTVVAAQTQRQLQRSAELYYDDMGFYPPDVGRGWDPGFTKALPNNKDTGANCASNPSDCPACAWCPPDWITQAQAKWKGPYIQFWPDTPWGGKADYNYWPDGASRYGCAVAPGIYIGMQGDYSDNNKIPADAEQELLNKHLDSDNCLNGESQLLLHKL